MLELGIQRREEFWLGWIRRLVAVVVRLGHAIGNREDWGVEMDWSHFRRMRWIWGLVFAWMWLIPRCVLIYSQFTGFYTSFRKITSLDSLALLLLTGLV